MPDGDQTKEAIRNNQRMPQAIPDTTSHGNPANTERSAYIALMLTTVCQHWLNVSYFLELATNEWIRIVNV